MLKFATIHLNEAITTIRTTEWYIKRDETLLHLCVSRGDSKGEPYLEHCDQLLLLIRNHKEALDSMSKSLNRDVISSGIPASLLVQMIKHFIDSYVCGLLIAAHLCTHSWHSADCKLREHQAPDVTCGCIGRPPSTEVGHKLDTLGRELGRITTGLLTVLIKHYTSESMQLIMSTSAPIPFQIPGTLDIHFPTTSSQLRTPKHACLGSPLAIRSLSRPTQSLNSA